MYTDSYDFKKTNHNQSIDSNYNTYSRRDYNYLPDINQGIYSSNLALVQFDLSSIYNSSRFTSTDDLVLVIPVCMAAAYGTDIGGILPPTLGSQNLISMKSNYINLIHQADVTVNGKQLNQLQPYTNVLKNFEMLSTMSADDLKVWGSSYGLGESLDNPRSVQLNTAPAKQGSGLCNNVPFGSTGDVVSSEYSPTAISTNYANNAINSRLNTFADLSSANAGAQGNKIYGNLVNNIMNIQQLANEFKPYYTILNNVMVWFDYAVIRVGSFLESMQSLGLLRRFDATLRLYINCGTVAIGVTSNVPINLAYQQATLNQSTFTNTCPIMINYLPSAQATLIVPNTTTQICAGLFIGSVPQTNVVVTGKTAINLGVSNARHPLNTCRMYYSSIEIGDARQTLQYIESNRAKKVVYRSFVSNFISNVTGGSSYSALIQSGLTNPVAVIIFPWISNATATFLGQGAPPQWGSPYDAGTGSPCSLTNLQVTVGGVNVLNTTLNYTYDNFLQQVSQINQISGNDFGVSVGLFDRKYWEMNRAYVVLIRSKAADMEVPRNINISFNNNNICPIDLMCFSIYLDSCIIDVDNGRVTK